MGKILKDANNALLMMLCPALIFIAEISTSTASLCWWHEPDCPPELLK